MIMTANLLLLCHINHLFTLLRLSGVLVVVIDAFHGCWLLFGGGCGRHVLLASLLGGSGHLLGSCQCSLAGGVV